MCSSDEFMAISHGENASIKCSDENITAFIEENLGDAHVNWATLIPLTITYSIFLIVGISGNLSTCIVIISNEYMRTATNVYLLNLAIADIATLVLSKYAVSKLRSYNRFLLFECHCMLSMKC